MDDIIRRDKWHLALPHPTVLAVQRIWHTWGSKDQNPVLAFRGSNSRPIICFRFDGQQHPYESDANFRIRVVHDRLIFEVSVWAVVK